MSPQIGTSNSQACSFVSQEQLEQLAWRLMCEAAHTNMSSQFSLGTFTAPVTTSKRGTFSLPTVIALPLTIRTPRAAAAY